MPTLFTVEPDDIGRLDARQMTGLLDCLIANELSEHNVRRTTAYVSLDINIPDGGADGLVIVGSAITFPQMDHIPSRNTLFQSKSGALRKAQFVSEMFTPGSPRQLKPHVREIVEKDGTYILFYGHPCLPASKAKRIAEMKAALRDHCPNNNPDVIILDRSEIAAWANRYLPAIIRVSYWARSENLDGMVSWNIWSEYEFNKNTYFADDTAIRTISLIRSTFTKPKSSLRLVGQSGLGKSRLALEALRAPETGVDDPDQAILSNSVVYIENATNGNIIPKIIDMRALGISGIIVADNCNAATHEALVREIVQHSASKMSLLSIDYHVDDDEDRPGEVRVKKASLEILRRMIGEAHPKLSQHDLELVARYADGYPKIAARLAEAPLDNKTTFDVHPEDSLTESLLWGRSQPDDDARRVIETLSLFANVGFENKVKPERTYVAALCGMTQEHFFEKAMYFSPRILDIIGDFVRVSPLPLALRLAENWYKKHDKDATTALLTDSKMPLRLGQARGERFAGLGDVGQGREISRRLLDPNAPFGTAEALNTEQGSRAFRYLAEVNPQAAMNALVREFGSMSLQQLRTEVGPGRRNIIWALEKLIFNRDQFKAGVLILARLAAAENETWGNNATGDFLGHFQMILGGTEAEPDLRLEALDQLIATRDPVYVSLAIRGLGRAVTEGHSRVLGAEQQGRKILRDWQPKTNGEAHAYFDGALERLATLACQDGDIGDLARERIARGIPYVLRYRPQSIDRALKKVMSNHRRAWPKAMENIEWAIRVPLKDGPQDILDMAKSWLDLIQPKDFEEQVRLIISIPPRGSLEDRNGTIVNLSQERAGQLAESLGSDRSAWLQIIPLISSGTQREAFAFGFRMGQLLPASEQLFFGETALSALAQAESPTPLLLMGLLGGFPLSDRANTKALLRSIVGTPCANKFAAKIFSVVAADEDDMRLLIPLLNDAVLEPADFTDFAYSQSLRNVTPRFVSRYFRSLLHFGVAGAQSALFIITMYTHGANKERWSICEPLIYDIVKTKGLLEAEERSQMDHFSLEEAAKRLLKESKKATTLAGILAREIARICKKYEMSFSAYDVMRPIAFTLIKDHEDVTWPIFKKALAKANGMTRWHFLHLFESSLVMRDVPKSALLYLSDAHLQEWCEEQPTMAPTFIARNVPLYNYDGTKIHVSPITRFLFNKYGDSDRILSEMSANIESFANMGSLVPAYMQRLAFVNEFLTHPNPNVAQWAAKYAASFDSRVRSQQNRDAEMAEGIVVPPYLDEM